MISKKVAAAAGVIGIIGLITVYGCATQPGAGPAPEKQVEEAAAKPEKVSPLYKKKIKPLTTAECGRCHFSVFQAIKTQGGKHQIECGRCHTEYHVYSPRKRNYNKIMPKCASCHLSASGGPFHGKNKRLTRCLKCHADPHKPLQMPVSEVEASCGLCHSKEGKEIKKYPSKHKTDVSCTDCHAEKHGYIPACSACHESHSPDAELATKDCMACHPVHKPTRISYTEDAISTICAGCHGKAYELLQKKETKHTAIKCAECHPAHKEIPPCSRCHGEPHPKRMMMDVTKCGDCHGIAHKLAS